MAEFPNENSPVLHIYGQALRHDMAVVLGNKEGLRRLQRAVEGALYLHRYGRQLLMNSPTASVAATDGEGCFVHVVCDDREDEFPLPYTDECAQAPSPAADYLAGLPGPLPNHGEIARIDTKWPEWLTEALEKMDREARDDKDKN